MQGASKNASGVYPSYNYRKTMAHTYSVNVMMLIIQPQKLCTLRYK